MEMVSGVCLTAKMYQPLCLSHLPCLKLALMKKLLKQRASITVSSNLLRQPSIAPVAPPGAVTPSNKLTMMPSPCQVARLPLWTLSSIEYLQEDDQKLLNLRT